MYKTALVVKGKLALAQYSICLGAGVPVTNCAGGGQVVGRAGPLQIPSSTLLVHRVLVSCAVICIIQHFA